MELKTVATPHAPVRYLELGSGAPLVVFHGAGGWTAADDPFLEGLGERYHVFAPFLPGYGDSEECPEIRDMLDFALHGWDVVEALGLKDPYLVGGSMGGMIAAEMAAIAPNDVTRLGLIAPAGLWLDEHPAADLFSAMPYEIPALMFHDAKAGEKLMTSGLDVNDPKFLQTYLVRNARQLGMAGRILFPIPDRGLKERLYRIKAATKIIWGASDRTIPPIYGDEFRRRIRGASLTVIEDAGHAVTMEKPAEVVSALM